MDTSFGRKPFLCIFPFLGACTRALRAAYPSQILVHSFSTLLLSVSCSHFWNALNASIGDLLGRTSDEFTRVSRAMENIATCVRLLIYAGRARGMLASDVKAMACASALGGVAALIFTFCAPETLEKPKTVPASSSPLNGFRVFTKTQRMRKLGLLLVLSSLPAYNGTLSSLRRSKFQWTSRDESMQHLLCDLGVMLNSYLAVPALKRLGLLEAYQWSQRVSVLMQLNNALSPNGSSAKFNALGIALMHGSSAFDRKLYDTASTELGSDSGVGEVAAAISGLELIPGLFAPPFFSELYSKTEQTFPGAAAMVCAVIHAFLGEYAAPMLWSSKN